MDPWPNFSETVIRQHASPESYRRGQDYYEQGAVRHIVRRGQQLQAEVEGSQYEPYQVQIILDEGGIFDADCTCPYDWGGWCKHIVATALTCLHHPEAIVERPSVEDLLAGLNRQQLQALLLHLTESQPGLADVIEAQVQSVVGASLGPTPAGGPQPSAQTGAAAAEGAPPRQRHTAVDASAYRRQVYALLHSLDRMRASEAYWHVGSVVSQVLQVLQPAQDFLTAGDGRNALAILEAVTEEYLSEWTTLDDSDGEVGGFFADLGPLWAEAILTADLTADERRAWSKKLAKWQQELDDYGLEETFAAAMEAAKQGWDYPPLQQVLQGEITEKGAWEGDAPECADDLAVARLKVLERQGRHQEYLHLAEAESQTELYVTMLVRLGRVQEAVSYGLQYFGLPGEALTLAKALRQQGALKEALQIAEHGLTFQGPKAELAAWLSELALGLGETGRALAAAQIAFQENLTLTAYRRVQDLAGERWLAIKTDLLAQLAKSGHVASQVEIYLSEGMVNEAVQAIDAEKYVGYDTLERVVDVAIHSHPDWVIRHCRQQAESIMDEGKSKYYHHAVRWLGKARAAYRSAGREAEWQAYLRELLTRHQRKYSLVPQLETLRR